MNNSNIVSIFKSRQNLLDILKERGFNIDKYTNFTINEIGVLSDTNQLDMLIEDDKTKKKIYVKYYVSKLLKMQNIYDMIQDLYYLENILTKNDDLMIIIKDEPNETLIQNVVSIWMAENIYISILNIKRLQFNILKHHLVPKQNVLNSIEEEEFRKKFNITNNKEIPDISYFSPICLVLGVRPTNIIKIERKSRTAIDGVFYRICKI